MLLCVCHAVSDRTVRSLVRFEGCDAASISCRTGAGTACGACVEDLHRLVGDVEDEEEAAAESIAAK
jgi:bacterioferritin-associated ferredoxin